MASPLESAKTASAVLEKFPPGVPPLAPEADAARRIQQAANEKGALSAIDSMRAREPLDTTQAVNLVSENVGLDKGALTPAESARKTQAEAAIKLADKFVQKGYDGLSATEIPVVRDRVIAGIESWPEGKSFLDALRSVDPAAADRAIEEILKNPALAPKVREIFALNSDPSRLISRDQIEKLKKDKLAFASKLLAKQAEITRADHERTQARVELDKFNPGNEYAVTLSGIDPITLNAEISTKKGEITTLQDDLDSLIQERNFSASIGDTAVAAAKQAEILTKTREAKTKAREVQMAEAKLAEKSRLEQLKIDQQAKWDESKDKVDLLTSEKTLLDHDLASLNIALTSAENEHENADTQFVKDLDEVITRATAKLIEDKINAVDQARQELIAKELSGTLNDGERRLLTALNKRYVDFKVEEVRTMRNLWSKRLETTRVLKKDQIKSDFETAIREDDGRAAMVKKMLQEQGMADPEIDGYLNNKEFMDKMGNRVMTELLEKRLETGELTDAERQKLQQSEWGKEVVAKAIEANEHRIKDMEKKGTVAPGTWEKIKNMDFAKASGDLVKFLLYVLFGATIAAVFGPGAPFVGGAIGGLYGLSKIYGGGKAGSEAGHGGAPTHKPEPEHH